VDAERRIAELESELAAKDARIAEQDARIAELTDQLAKVTKQVAELTERLGRNSGNSNKPPSSDSPGNRAERRAKAKQDRKRGAQPGHAGSKRTLLPVEQVDEFVHLFATQCENCWASLPQTPDPSAARYQTTELPPIKPHITEYVQHGVVCPCCKHRTWGPYDKIPVSPFGPRLSSIVALLTGVYHLSRRAAADVLRDVVGVQISLGALSAVEARVSDAVAPAVDEAWTQVRQAPVKHTDGTSWFQSSLMCSLWTVATTAVTVFKIVKNGKKETLRALFGELRGILVSDRATALHFWAMERRQICWAHLLRKFVSFSERAGPAAAVGGELLEYAGIMFAYWNDLKTGKLSRRSFQQQMAPLRTQFESALQRAAAADIELVAGSCADILEHNAALWTFVDRDDVEPTNNHAERELRAFVLWRKRSFGTQSERGNLFAERLMTVAHTARKQNKNVLAFLTACCTAARDGSMTPSLLAA
jgi:transposase